MLTLRDANATRRGETTQPPYPDPDPDEARLMKWIPRVVPLLPLLILACATVILSQAGA